MQKLRHNQIQYAVAKAFKDITQRKPKLKV